MHIEEWHIFRFGKPWRIYPNGRDMLVFLMYKDIIFGGNSVPLQ